MRYYSKRELYALGETLGDSVTEHKVGGGRVYGGGGKGGGGAPAQPTSTTSYQTSIPEYARPYVETMLGATQKQLFNMDESGGITGFQPYTPYSQNAQDYVAPFTKMQQSSQQRIADMSGSMMPGVIGGSALGSAMAGQNFANMATDPGAQKAYMSPYMQNVVDVQKAEAMRDAQKGLVGQNMAAARQGTYGGARNALMQSEADRNLQTQLGQIQATGQQNAFQNAQQSMLAGQQLGLQGYGQAGQLAGQQLAAEQGISQAQAQAGALQQAQQQQMINQKIQDYANAQQYPLMQLGTMSNMLRGLPMQAQTTNQYVAAPNPITQGIGLAGAGASIYNAVKQASGGQVKEMASGGITSYNVGGRIKSELYGMDPNEIQDYIKESSSPMAKKIAEEVLRDKTGQAGGGIIAFASGSEDAIKEDPAKVRQAYIEAANIERNKIPENLRYDPEKIAAQDQLIKDVGSQLNRAPVATSPGAGGQGITADVLKRIAARDYQGIATAAPAAPAAPAALPVANPNANLPPMPTNVKTDELGRADANKQGPAVPVSETRTKDQIIADANKDNASIQADPNISKEDKARIQKRHNDGIALVKADPNIGVKTTAPGGIGIKPNTSLAPDIGGIKLPTRPVEETQEQLNKGAEERVKAYGINEGNQKAMSSLMAERANAKDEARRITSLRMAEFFGAWGSTPGNTIVAGLNALKNKIPDFVSDIKEESKIRRQIDKDIAELDKLDREEKNGIKKDYFKERSDLANRAMHMYGYELTAQSADKQTRAYREVGMTKAATAGGGENKQYTALVGRRTDIEKAITAKIDKLDPMTKTYSAMESSKDPKVQEKINAAKAKVALETKDLEKQRTEIQAVINTIKKIDPEHGINDTTSPAAAANRPALSTFQK